MRVLIYGGRDWEDQLRMSIALDQLHQQYTFTKIINGGQVSRSFDGRHRFGADWQASVWAKKNGIPIDFYLANWALGTTAGPFRNERMLVVGKPELGIQFPGGRGTQDMRRRLDRAGIPVIEPMKVEDASVTDDDADVRSSDRVSEH
jgi:hypothetical protein